MALTFPTTKFTDHPLIHNSVSLNPVFSSSKPTFPSLKPRSSSLRTTDHRRGSREGKNGGSFSRNSVSSAPWVNKSNPIKGGGERDGKNVNLEEKPKVVEQAQGKGKKSIEGIMDRLRDLGLGSDEEEALEEGGLGSEVKLVDLLKKNWGLSSNADEEDDGAVLPWERGERRKVEGEGKKVEDDKRVRAPTMAELTIEEVELKRLRTLGMRMSLRERISIAKAGVTTVIVEKIHDRWRRSELVRLKFHETLAHDMRTAHEIVERRTGGLVIWRSGSVMVVFRGINYKRPSSRPQSVNGKGDKLLVPHVSPADNGAISTSDETENLAPVESLTEEEMEYNRLLDGLGPRFVDWWGTGWIPIDAELLPKTIPDYKTPFRLLPSGMRSRLTNAEMTNLRNLSKSLPSHFALGRNRNHQGLASAIVKLWEKSLVAKIAIKPGIQNTNNKIMAEEIKTLTGGTLLLRDKFFIVIYRGKDFVPSSVAAALAERQELTKEIQDAEEKARVRSADSASVEEIEGKPLAGTLAEFHEAKARWGKEVTVEEFEKMKQDAIRDKNARVVNRIEHKLVAAQAKQLRAEKLLAKIETSMVPVRPSDDQETITDEERSMFRRVGLKMKAYLPLGVRGVFAGVIENMHLHWKHRELVKLISKQKTLAFVEDSARLMEYESGGILVAIERVPKGFALIYYRGKNYQRPLSMRPRNLLTKAKALKRSIAIQRHEALCQHISELENNIEEMESVIRNSRNLKDGETLSLKDQSSFDSISKLTQSEDEGSSVDSDYADDEDDDSKDDDSEDDYDGDENLDWESDEE